MAENTGIVSKEEDPKAPSNGFSLFPKFNLQLPFFKQQPKKAGVSVEDEPTKAVLGDDENQTKSQKPEMVSFPKAQPVFPPPLAVENEEHGKTSNPVILWQVYALGGFLVLRWIWARWNERKAGKKDSSDDDQSPADE
ncbi:hypothetical protein FNV43_RR25237 [Rhamnella rubrinervis]|uniref:Uncharacterized protein n=1 Tax=Rhamnella rubrinervis TaxID=2594499 RepID=A0A8K0DU63_9ROSA|nr:hypothetical protein FNV43_RR25237 [Rhamnella rubrinervis]